MLVVGGERAAAELATWFAKHQTAGYEVCGVWVPDESHAARCDHWRRRREASR